MAVVANITIDDGATTPVARTFTPVAQAIAKAGSKVSYLDRSANGGIAVGFPELHITAENVLGNDPIARYRVKASYPVLETISNNTASGYAPAPQKAYHLQYEGVWTIPKRSTTVDRQTFGGLIANLYDYEAVKDMINNFNPVT